MRKYSMCHQEEPLPLSLLLFNVLFWELPQVSPSWILPGSTITCASLAGAEWDPGLTYLSHEAGPECTAPGGPGLGRPVWKCSVIVWTRLLHPEAAPEDYWGGTSHYRRSSCVWVYGTGAFGRAGLGAPQKKLAMSMVARRWPLIFHLSMMQGK